MNLGDGISQLVQAYDRRVEANPKEGYRLLGKVMFNGVAYQVTGFISLIGGKSSKGRTPATAAV
jgi:hypothetical protein